MAAAAALVIAGFFPWITVSSQNLVITGINAQKFGSPAFMHFFFTALIIVLSLVTRRWAQIGAVIAAALNAAWGFRNFILLAACPMGECPEKHPALYVVLTSSLLMLVASLFIKTAKSGRQAS